MVILNNNLPVIEPFSKRGLVSVIITTYNQPDFLSKAVESVLRQTHAEWELVIVDDGSSDGLTAEICREFASREEWAARIKVISLQNGGVSRARNFGLAHSDLAAPFTLFLDGDDELLPGALSALTRCLEAHPSAVAVQGFRQIIDSAGNFIEDCFPQQDLCGREVAFEEFRGFINFYPPGTVLCRKWAVWAANGFDVTLSAIEDFNFFLRLSLWGNFVGLSKPVCLYRKHSSNITLDNSIMRNGLQEASLRAQFLSVARKISRPDSESDNSPTINGGAS